MTVRMRGESPCMALRCACACACACVCARRGFARGGRVICGGGDGGAAFNSGFSAFGSSFGISAFGSTFASLVFLVRGAAFSLTGFSSFSAFGFAVLAGFAGFSLTGFSALATFAGFSSTGFFRGLPRVLILSQSQCNGNVVGLNSRQGNSARGVETRGERSERR